MSCVPIIAGFYPDPSICQHEGVFYIANSSFEYAPGVPIHASSDLKTWTPLGNALSHEQQLNVRIAPPSTGIYATTIRFHERFWLATTNVIEYGRGQMLVSAESAAGPWSNPVYVEGAIGIDPDLCWDEQGTCHLTWASSVPGKEGIASVPIDPESGTMLAEPVILWQGTGLANPEGPHLYRVEGWWYLMLAEGGTERGHAITIARSRALDQPFTPAPTNPILSHRSTSEPVQNTGHGDLIELTDGSWAMVYLGVRPRGRTPMFHVNGRETFLAGIDWVDGWPVVDQHRFRAEALDHSFTDHFSQPSLHQRWISPNRHLSDFTSVEQPTGIRMRAASGNEPTGMLLARARDSQWVAEATMDVSAGTCRFLVRIDKAHWYGIALDAETAEAVAAIGPSIASIGRASVLDVTNVTVRISVREPAENPINPHHEPDIVELALITPDGAIHNLASLDGRYLSTEVAGGFTGRTFGVEPLSGEILVKEVTYQTTP